MKIALGCDHRGGKIAYRLTKDIFLRDHYTKEQFDKQTRDEQLIGAYLIENATVSDAFVEQADEEDEEPKVYPIFYGCVSKAQAESSCENLTAQNQGDATVRIDYPNVAAAVAQAVSEKRADFGILICGTGIGMGITANKFKGIRAAVCYNEVAAELSRLHNDANVLCVSGEILSVPALEALVRKWLVTPFEGGRHIARIAKIDEVER